MMRFLSLFLFCFLLTVFVPLVGSATDHVKEHVMKDSVDDHMKDQDPAAMKTTPEIMNHETMSHESMVIAAQKEEPRSEERRVGKECRL